MCRAAALARGALKEGVEGSEGDSDAGRGDEELAGAGGLHGAREVIMGGADGSTCRGECRFQRGEQSVVRVCLRMHLASDVPERGCSTCESVLLGINVV